MASLSVSIQVEDFDIGQEHQALRAQDERVGAVCSFLGTVRSQNDGLPVTAMALEHYPGMTERALDKIVVEAKGRWDIFDALVIHRVGRLEPLDHIVLVVTVGAHRGEAFSACEFIMDYLKTQAPFWKKEATAAGSHRWVEARASDDEAAAKWRASGDAGADTTQRQT